MERMEYQQLLEPPSVQTTGPTHSWSTCSSKDLVEDHPSLVSLVSRPSRNGNKRCWDFCALCDPLSHRKGGPSHCFIQIKKRKSTLESHAELTVSSHWIDMPTFLLYFHQSGPQWTLLRPCHGIHQMGGLSSKGTGQEMLAGLRCHQWKSFPCTVLHWFSYTSQHPPSHPPSSTLGPYAM